MKLTKSKAKPPKYAFDQGVNAFYKGNLNNPYKPRTYYWKEWHRGFDTAYFNNLAIAS